MAKSDDGELNRSIVASNTSDRNNSLLQKVTKRVSGLIPTSLTKWFGPSEGTHSVIRRRESEDEDDTDSSLVQPPPKKRVKLPTDVEYATSESYTTITSTSLVNSRDLRHLQPGPSGSNARQTTNTQYEPLLTTTNIINGDDRSDSGESTSGYSSVPAQHHKESFSENMSRTSLNKSLNLSMNSTRSLFSEQSLNPNRSCLSARRPTFNASTFGSPSFVDRTLSTKRAVNSPFYGGRTMYGGANAYRRNRIIFPRDESNNIVVKNSINMKPINESTNESVSLSKTARRILDTLEHFSTPVLDAKKIPSINKPSISESVKLNQRRTLPYAREKASTRELLVPGIPDLLKMKMKERLQNSTEQVRKVATTSKSVLNTEYSIRTVEEDTNKPLKHTSKMKSKLVQVRQKKDDSHDVIDAVKLPEVKLPITNLPKFDFTLPPPPTVIPKSPGTFVKSTSKQCQPIQKAPLNPYQFAPPIILSHTPKSVTSINNFKFSEPLDSKSNPIPAITFKSSGSTAPRKKESKNNGQNETHIGLQPSKELVSGSVMDILGPAKSKVNSTKPVENLMDKFKPAAGTWVCNTCMIRNENGAIKCGACETPKEPAKKVEVSSGFGDKFKPASNTWECSACMVRNNSTETKCVACTTPKATATPVASKPIAASSSGFDAKFKPAANTWECFACLIRNEVESTKCIACETPKPGTKVEAKPSLVMPPDLITKSGFGDLIQKQQSNWECGSCMVRNPPEKNCCVCCETPKPGVTQTSLNVEVKPTGTQFKFGIDKASTQTDGFQFGADKSNSTSTGFKFGTDKAQNPSLATFTFGIKPAEVVDSVPTSTIVSNSTTAFTFGATKSKALTPTKTDIVNTVTSTVNKTPISTSSATTTHTETLKTFTFGTGSPNTFAVTPTFAFGTVSSTTTQNTTAKPTFSFGATATTTTPVATSTTVPVNVSSTTPSSTTSNIFGNTAPIVAVTTISFVTTTTPAATTTFTFGNAAPKLGSDSLPAQQFNFGATLPFNPTYPSKTVTATTSTTTSSFGSTFASTSNVPSSFASQPPTLNLNNTKNKKPFGFTSGEPLAKIPTFSFAPTEKAAAPLAKAPVYSFGGASGVVPGDGFNAPAPPNATAGLFGFNTPKTEKPSTFGGTPVAHTVSPMFGAPAQQAQTPQNGGFNFGAPNATPSFNFGAGAVTTPAVFGFGANQAGTDSAAANSTAAPLAASSSTAGGVFAFGQQQQQIPAFSPDIKPNFNFTTSSPAPTFIPQGGPSQTTLPQRRIRKAVRRTQPR